MTTSAPVVVLDVQPASVENPRHLHQTWALHRLVAGCTAACGHPFTSDGNGERDGIPHDACATCAEAAIFRNGVICWGPR